VKREDERDGLFVEPELRFITRKILTLNSTVPDCLPSCRTPLFTTRAKSSPVVNSPQAHRYFGFLIPFTENVQSAIIWFISSRIVRKCRVRIFCSAWRSSSPPMGNHRLEKSTSNFTHAKLIENDVLNASTTSKRCHFSFYFRRERSK